MSEDSAGEDVRRRCVSSVVHRTIGCDAEKTKKLAIVLRDDDVISKRERTALTALIKDGKCKEAIEEMIESICNSEDGLIYIIEAAKSEDLELDEKIPQILATIFSSDEAAEVKIRLLSLWDELVTFHQDVKPVIEQLWPEKTELTETQWPLNFIHFCITSQDLQKVEEFVDSTSFLKAQAQTTEDQEEELGDETLRAEALENQGPMSDLESFVILDMDGEQGSVSSRGGSIEAQHADVAQHHEESFVDDDFNDIKLTAELPNEQTESESEPISPDQPSGPESQDLELQQHTPDSVQEPSEKKKDVQSTLRSLDQFHAAEKGHEQEHSTTSSGAQKSFIGSDTGGEGSSRLGFKLQGDPAKTEAAPISPDLAIGPESSQEPVLPPNKPDSVQEFHEAQNRDSTKTNEDLLSSELQDALKENDEIPREQSEADPAPTSLDQAVGPETKSQEPVFSRETPDSVRDPAESDTSGATDAMKLLATSEERENRKIEDVFKSIDDSPQGSLHDDVSPHAQYASEDSSLSHSVTGSSTVGHTHNTPDSPQASLPNPESTPVQLNTEDGSLPDSLNGGNDDGHHDFPGAQADITKSLETENRNEPIPDVSIHTDAAIQRNGGKSLEAGDENELRPHMADGEDAGVQQSVGAHTAPAKFPKESDENVQTPDETDETMKENVGAQADLTESQEAAKQQKVDMTLQIDEDMQENVDLTMSQEAESIKAHPVLPLGADAATQGNVDLAQVNLQDNTPAGETAGSISEHPAIGSIMDEHASDENVNNHPEDSQEAANLTEESLRSSVDQNPTSPDLVNERLQTAPPLLPSTGSEVSPDLANEQLQDAPPPVSPAGSEVNVVGESSQNTVRDPSAPPSYTEYQGHEIDPGQVDSDEEDAEEMTEDLTFAEEISSMGSWVQPSFKNPMYPSSFASIAEQQQIEEVIRATATENENQVHSGTEHVQFRAFFTHCQALFKHHWKPTIKIGKTHFPMHLHRMGYYFAFISSKWPTIVYCYAFVKGKYEVNEYLPKESKRLLRLDKGEVVFDVASFSGEKKWDKVVAKNISRYLPKPNELFRQDYVFFPSYVYNWMKTITYGWQLTGPNYFCVISTSEMEQTLKDWLASIEGSSDRSTEHIEKHILCSLAVTVALRNLQQPIENPKLFNRICEGLWTHELTAESQLQLFALVVKKFDCLPQLLCESLEFLFGHCNEFTEPATLLLSFPLYWIMVMKGMLLHRMEMIFPDLLYDRGMLPKMKEGYWGKVRQNFLKNSKKKLKDLCDSVEVISKTHPWIVDTYQYFISPFILIKLINEKHFLTYQFLLDSVFTQLLPLFDPVNFSAVPKKTPENRKKVIEESSYLKMQFLKFSNSAFISGLSKELKVYKARSACYILRLLHDAVTAVVNDKVFDSSQRSSILWLMNMANLSLSWFYELDVKEHCPQVPKILRGILDSVKLRVSEFTLLRNEMTVKEVTFYENLLKKNWCESTFQESWNVELKEEIKKALNDVWSEDESSAEFLKFYLVTLKDVNLDEQLESLLQAKAEICAISALNYPDTSSGANRLSWNSILPLLIGDRSNMVFANAFLEEFKKYHGNEQDDKLFKLHAKQFLAESPVVLRFYRAFSAKSIAKLFSSRKYYPLKRVDDVAKGLLANFSHGNITIEELEILLKHHKTVKELLSLKESQGVTAATPKARDMEIELLFTNSESRLKGYEVEMHAFKFFAGFFSCLCGGIKVDCRELSQIYERRYSTLVLQHLDAYSVEAKQKDEILLMAKLKGSQVFQQKAHQIAQEVHSSNLPSHLNDGLWYTTWEEVLKLIWNPVKNELLNFIASIDEGVVPRETLIEEFKFTGGIEDDLRKELLILLMFSATCQRRHIDEPEMKKQVTEKSRQLFIAFEMQRKQEVLKWFGDFQKKHNLQGDFTVISKARGEILTEKEYHELDDVLKTDGQQLEVLQKFTAQQNLIEWLQSKMKDEGQVRGLCLVAVESSRHSPAQADKWSFLSDAVAGFEALTFHLDEIRSHSDLLARCKDVWAKIESDKTILKKWSDVGRDIDFYKENEHWYGSEDQAASHFAQEANSHGIYTIGHIRSNVDSNSVSLKHSIILEFSKTPNIPKKQVASDEKTNEETEENVDEGTTSILPPHVDIDYLHDVESKLTLIASDDHEKNNDIKQFGHVLNAMEGLATAYVHLVNAGFMLFNDWKVIASVKQSEGGADVMAEHILTLQIFFKSNARPLTKTASINDVTSLSDLLRDALKKWNRYVSSMRLKHYFLNEYSIQQIRDLCGQLGKIRQSPLEEQTYALLSDLPRNIMTPIIQESLVEAMATCEEEVTEDEEREVDADATVSEEVALTRAKRRAVRQLVNRESTTEALAKAAVQAEGHADYTKCCNWILLHEYDDDLVDDLTKQFDQAAGFVHDETDIQEDVSILQSKSAKTLEGIIEILQNRAADTGCDLLEAVKTIYVGYLNNTTSLTLHDYLSVNHLGKFLTILHAKLEGIRSSPSRSLPSVFKSGVPNFILSDGQGVVPLILSLYACQSGITPNQSQLLPLPLSQEVLICSADTKSEEVERFMLQAMCRHPTKAKLLFCMAYVEMLDFDASRALENVYGKLSHDAHASGNYQLVVISSDHHHYVTNIFDKYHVEKLPPDFSEEYIATYTKKHMSKKTELGQGKVKVVSSRRSGVGKSLHVKRIVENLKNDSQSVTIRLLEKDICMSNVIGRLFRKKYSSEKPQLIHIDVTPAVENGVEKFMFELFILGMIKDSSGKVWRRRENHSYVVEVTKPMKSSRSHSHTLDLLPAVQCLSPLEVLKKYQEDIPPDSSILLMDEIEYESDIFQRPYQYLLRLENKENLSKFDYETAKHHGSITGNHSQCIDILISTCGIKDPSWAQLKHFVSFLNVQLVNCEKSVYCLNLDVLKGLKELAIKFMIKMAQDFATPSLVISDESSKVTSPGWNKEKANTFEQHQLRRKWEEKEHPYVFFNDDGVTMSFINVNIDKRGNLRDSEGNIIEENITSPQLVRGLHVQGTDLSHNFDALSRMEMIEKLCLIMGVTDVFDPDPTYELTTDNVLKMIAIYMRLRCGIPVIIMGETGCGKTRMVEFMSKLQAGRSGTNATMNTLKIHGGTGVADIFKSVKNAAQQNSCRKMLFYDEANTTTAIYAIKEVMCDATINGDSFASSNGESVPKVQIVAACNPYKQLSSEAVAKLEASGLGYRVAASESEKLGNIAMRTLVYRVVALPPSIQPFVWDFGQLANKTEQIYIEKMIGSKLKSLKYGLSKGETNLIVSVLSHIQSYMKEQKGECRYVSLRDVERTIKLFKWFHRYKHILFKKADEVINQPHPRVFDSLRCLIHAVGITYHVSLEDRAAFRGELSNVLSKFNIEFAPHELLCEYTACQIAFHRDLKTDDDIAWNEALRENVFLMAVCADAKLPLYLIGKPGSSKSLAKSIVDANMKGPSSSSPIFKLLKKVEMLSYQCSALTETSGIRKIFKDAGNRQKKKDLKKFASMVVLDEIGLAEDSPSMPLKILHPLLECGNDKSGGLTEYKEYERVAFVGISNWALDPAKMNRGIFVTRSAPDKADLFNTATGIFQGSQGKINQHYTLLQRLTETYLDLCKNQGDQYFGLRDYYCIIKMVHAMCKQGNQEIDKKQIAYLLVRNLSGGTVKHERALKQAVRGNIDLPEAMLSQVTLKELVQDNIRDAESRFLLLLTAENSSVSLLHYITPDFDQTSQVIFGSSFPGDHSYKDICKNINQIKLCMERGIRVVLLNMSEIHESLYDVLNQYYIRFGGQRYVAIGLGSHRVWTRVHENFRLIVIEKREIVQKNYPIPLVNRLEKHHLLSRNLLTEAQLVSSEQLTQWMEDFADVGCFTVRDAFIGSHSDTASSIVLAHGNEDRNARKAVMLKVATTDAVYRLTKGRLNDDEKRTLIKIYMEEQCHDCLFTLLQKAKKNTYERIQIYEVISFSKILTEEIRMNIETKLNLIANSVMLLSLQQFKVEQEYTKKLDDFFLRCEQSPKKGGENVAVLLIQISKAHHNGQLIECAKHYFMNRLREVKSENLLVEKVLVAFILSTERYIGRNGNSQNLILQHTNKWSTIYVDELRHMESNSSTTLISSFYEKSLTDILKEGKDLIDNYESTKSHVLWLLQDCISEAMSKVSCTAGTNGRQLQRIKELRQVCSQAFGQVGQGFLKVLLQKMMKFSSAMSDKSKWIVQEACSQKNLQEGGTFGKTIHLYLKRCLADMLAYIVSIIDENDNLSILLSSEQGTDWKIELWLQIFSIFDIGKPHQEQGEYTVKGPKHLNLDFACRFPFGFVLHEIFSKLYCEGKLQDMVEHEQFFFNTVQKKNDKVLKKVLQAWNLETYGMKMMEAYAYDLMKFRFSEAAKSNDELDNLAKILFEFSKKRFLQEREFSGVAMTFYTFKQLTEHLRVISATFNICPDILSNVNAWIENQEQEQDFRIHEHALNDILEWAHKKAEKICDEQTCMEWMSVCSQMKTTYNNFVDMIDKEERKQELKKKWKPLALLDTLLTHLLPWNKKDPDYKKYVGLIVGQAMRLFKALETMNLHSKEVLKIMTTILRKSYEDLELKLKMKWQKPLCVCGQRILIPIRMPCGGYICQACANLITGDSRICPRCTSPIPDGFEARPECLSPANEKELQRFQANCTGFFLEYLHGFCFKGHAEESDGDEKILAIFENILVPDEIKSVEKRNKFKLETGKLDFNIATKSSVFLLLIKLRPELVKDKINEIFANENFCDDTLIFAILKGFENACASKTVSQESPDNCDELLRKSWAELLKNRGRRLTLDLIQNVAHARYALINLVNAIQKRRQNIFEEDMTPKVILIACDICKRKEAGMLRRFVTETAIVQYGKQWLQYIEAEDQLKVLTDQELTKDMDKSPSDHWTLLSDDYTSARSVNQSKQFTQWFPENKEVFCLKNLSKILAILKTKDSRMMKLLEQKMKDRALEWKFLLESDRVAQYITSVPTFTTQQGYAVYQAAILAVSIVLCKLPMMKELHDLVISPENTEQWFWPAMPEALYHHLNDAMWMEQPYSCPNGHVYYIGDCTYPWTTSKCPQCGAVIGGLLHMEATGNERLPTSIESQHGYQLHVTKMGVHNPADRITRQGAAVIQFFIHSCMILGMKNKRNEVLKIIQAKSEKDGYEFLAKKMQDNMEELSQGLGCSVDESIMIIHQILAKMTLEEEVEEVPQVSPSWTSRKERLAWEDQFRMRYLLPVFQDTDDYIFDAKQKLSTKTSIEKILREAVSISSTEQRLTCFHPILWKALKESTTNHLLHCIADSALPGGVLQTILNTPNIFLVKHLQNALRLQEEMIQRFHNKSDMKDVEDITFKQVQMKENYDVGKLIESYIDLWNMVYPIFLLKYSGDKSLSSYIKQIDVDDPITMALPSSRGRGRCAKLLIEYLIDLQNDFLQSCKDVDKSLEGITEVEVSKLLDSHFVCVDKQEDLLPMIQLHTAYSITSDEHGRHHHLSYNIPALEKLAKEKHALYKKKISKESLPCIKYHQDVGIGTDWDKVEENVQQIPLPIQIANEVNELVLRMTLADVCEGVRTLAQAISFLAKVKISDEDGNRKLRDYLENDLMLSSTHLTMIPKSALICHTLALYQKLSCHRAVRFVQQGLDPYKESLQNDEQEKITDVEILQNLKQAFEHMDLNSLQEHLNEMLIKVPDFRPDWSLTSDIFPDLEFIEEASNDSWYNRLPEEVCFKHVSDLFRLSVEGIGDILH